MIKVAKKIHNKKTKKKRCEPMLTFQTCELDH
jgi:hypothetical protein